jgi:tRNA(fMet)-specific endonuclease VapC
MRILLDSNRFIDYCAGDEEVTARLETTAAICIPFIVVAEIRAGALLTKRGLSQVRALNAMIQQPGVSVVHTTDTTCHHYAALYARLRAAGTPIPTNDLWIAALAIELGLVLYSRDAHFEHFPEIPRIST